MASVRMKPETFYAEIVGQVVRGRRELQGLTLQEMAQGMGFKSISGWSRIETGHVPLNVAQLRGAARILKTTAHAIAQEADAIALVLETRNVVVHDKQPPGHAGVGGAGLLALYVASTAESKV